jgi:hypothetical protein
MSPAITDENRGSRVVVLTARESAAHPERRLLAALPAALT